ncbi:MAG: hypothetical protein ACP5FL_09095 [Thermoplasmatota archaeon]
MRHKGLMKGIVCLLVAVMFVVPVNIASVNEQLPIVEQPVPCLQDNLAPNPSFEEGSGDMPDGWAYWGDHAFSWTSEESHTGSKSVSISNIRMNELGSLDTTELIEIDPVTNDYVFGAWYKYDAEPNGYNFAGLAVSPYDINKKPIDVTRVVRMPYLDQEWHYYQYIPCDHFNQSLIDNIKYVQLWVAYWAFSSVNPSEGAYYDDVYFGISEQQPFIEITKLSGGLGVSAIIKNSGDGDALNVSWTIDIEGNVFIGDKITSGEIDTLPIGATTTIRTGFLFGFGTGTVLVQVWDQYEYSLCFMLGPIVILTNQHAQQTLRQTENYNNVECYPVPLSLS